MSRPDADPVRPIASSPWPDDELVDVRVLATVGAPGSPFLTAVVARFASDLTDDLAALEAAVSAGTSQPVRRLCHTLRGRAAMLGARPLADLCARLERQSGLPSTDDLATLRTTAGATCRSLSAAARQASASSG